MRFKFFRSTSARTGRFFSSLPGTALLFGLVAGVYVVAWCHHFTATLGWSLAVVTSVALAVAVGVELAWRKPQQTSPNGNASAATLLGLVCLVPAAWSVGFGWLMQLATSAASRFSIEMLANLGPRLLLICAAALITLTIPVYALVRIPVYLGWLWSQDDSSNSAPRLRGELVSLAARFFLLGSTLGIVLDVFLLAPLVGAYVAGYAAAAISAGLVASVTIRASRGFAKQSVPTTVVPSTQPRARIPAVDTAWSTGVVGCLGVATALAMRMTNQLLPATGVLIWAEWASVMLCLSVGMFWSSRRQRIDNGKKSAATPKNGSVVLVAAGWCAVLPVVFMWYVDGLLLAHAYISPVSMQTMLRCLVAFSLLAPFGFAWGVIASATQVQGSETGRTERFPQFSLFAFMTGLLAVDWIIVARWHVEDVLPVVTASLGIAGFIRIQIPGVFGKTGLLASPRSRLRRLGIAIPVCLVIASPFLRHSYDPTRSARLLFSTNVFLARRNGMGAELLQFLDEGRLVARSEGNRSTFTVWKTRSAQLQIREGGIPKAIVSTDTRFCPQFSADIMQAALPLVLHESPRRLLLLGLQGGVTLETCTRFPLQELTCVESDSGLIRLVDNVVNVATRHDLFNDDRLRMLPIDPAVAIIADDNAYDVIISCSDQSALAQSTPYFTREFYRRVAARLAKGGIFCQRFQYVDFGPEPLQVVAKTMQSAFTTVTAVETAPGEMALLGTNSSRGLLRDGLIARLQAPHVRDVLSQAGWDWVVPLNLTAYNQTALAKFATEGHAGQNTAANGRFAFRLPSEVMRWAAKWKEIQQALAHCQPGSFLKWNRDADASDVLNRLEEISGQRTLIVRYPDQKWAYRKTLRERMREKPRTVIHQERGSAPKRRLHPEERRRKDYLRALSAAVQDPESENIRRIADFAQPYDPLVSFFLHDEIARLYKRADNPDPQSELEHRLYLVYFTDPRDRSIRNIVAALNLLVEHPEAAPDPAERRDHFDALLQMLKSRWHGRSAAKPISKNVALNDVAESVAAIESAFDALESLYRQCGLNESDWRSRRLVLERSLTRPLRTYRTQLLSRRQKPKPLPSNKQSNAN